VAAAQESTARLGHDDAAVHYESTLRLGPNGSADIELLLALAAEPRHRTGGRRAAGRPVLAMTGRGPATEDLTGDGVAVLRDRA
jgi:hypothetical protein